MAVPSEEAIMAAVQDGHTEMLGILFERYRHRALGLCLGIVGDHATAEDLVQEAFVRVLRYHQSFDGRSRFASWLFRVVKNVCLDHVDRVRRAGELRQEFVREQAVRYLSDEVSEERKRLLRNGLEALSAEKRDVLIMRRFRGLGYVEIGERLGITEGAARVRAHRALVELRDAVRRIEDGLDE